MSKRRRNLLVFLAVLALVLLVGPFLVPVPPLENSVPPQQLADPDSLFMEINGQSLHVKRYGEGEPVYLLLHGFASNTYTWHKVVEALAQQGTVIVYDRIGFGLSARPLTWTGDNPYTPEAQVAQAIGLLDALAVDQAILVGNSAGGTVATAVALAHPNRVMALVLADAAIYSGGGAPPFIKPLLRTPQMRRLGPLITRAFLGRGGGSLLDLAWHDPTLVTPEDIAAYEKPLRVENWDKALWEFTLASEASDLPGRLSELTLPVLVITGDDDRIVPTAESVRLADELPQAELVIIPNTGHVPQEESPEQFLDAVLGFVEGISSTSKD
ncbi:MAG TPA: alpha/beta hydrolase [Chloroflexota bacterium]|nr:alpha/beta hydrolase [Chloroflexota bacterium]